MGFFKKKRQTIETKNEFQLDETKLKKISMFITIVNRGQGNYVLKIFEQEGANAQFVQLGEGTAQKEVRDILDLDDNEKEIIISLITNERIESVKSELEAFFRINKRNRGIGFSIPMTSLIGMKVYQFLIDRI